MSLIEKIDAEIERLNVLENHELKHGSYEAAAHYKMQWLEARRIKEIILSEQKEPCEGCIYNGKYESEVEYGYNSPCTKCKRRCGDNYRPYTE